MTKPPEQYYPQPERDDLAFRMFAAWINCDPCMVPTQFKAWTCPQTRQAWGRVADAARSDPAVLVLVEALRAAARQHRVIAGLDLIGASVVAFNAALDAEAALAAFDKTIPETKGE